MLKMLVKTYPFFSVFSIHRPCVSSKANSSLNENWWQGPVSSNWLPLVCWFLKKRREFVNLYVEVRALSANARNSEGDKDDIKVIGRHHYEEGRSVRSQCLRGMILRHSSAICLGSCYIVMISNKTALIGCFLDASLSSSTSLRNSADTSFQGFVLRMPSFHFFLHPTLKWIYRLLKDSGILSSCSWNFSATLRIYLSGLDR